MPSLDPALAPRIEPKLAMRTNILVVEDESAIVELLRYNLERDGFRVTVAADGEEALTAIAEDKPDLVLLDWMLPNASGLEVCRQIRRKTATRDLPVIMLTARGEEADRVRGLDVGADDYVTKPFSITELMARVKALLRRARPARDAEVLRYADLELDIARHRVTRNGRPIHLGPTEFRLLRFLMERPGRVYSREQLLDSVWGHDIHVELRTVDVHIRRLRRALNAQEDTDLIRTVRAAGYALDTSAA
jgi:two-component system phosphate regulon response regulator PhoB